MKLILALIVTHNRLFELKNCIKAVNSQSKNFDKLLVINSGSTDGTKKYLNNNKIFAIHTKNLGSAGGWYRGIDYALKNDFKYIWMMDDDGYPDPQALENLISNYKEEFSCLSSLVIDKDNHKNLAIPLPILNKNELPIIFSFKRKLKKLSDLNQKHPYYNFANFFNGALINVSSIKKIGNINKEFFIYGEEVDFFHRLRSQGKVYTYIHSYHYHPSINKKWTRVKIYYYLKNSIYLNFKYYDFSILRSLLNILAIFYRIFKYNGPLFFIQTFSLNNLKNIISAIYKGFRSKIGIDYEI